MFPGEWYTRDESGSCCLSGVVSRGRSRRPRNFWLKLFSLRGNVPIAAETDTAKLPTATGRLTFLVLAAVLPVLAFAAFMIVHNAQVQRIQYEDQLQDTARATMLAIDAEVSHEMAILTTLTHTGELRDRNWRAFYDLAKSAIADQPDARIGLYDPSGHVLLSTFVPFGTDLPKSGSPEAISKVMTTRQPYVTDLYVGAASKEFVVAVHVPVIENGSVVNILSLAVPPKFVSRILHGQLSTPGTVGAVFDRGTKIIGRTRNEAQFVGHKAVPGYLEALQKSDEGSMEVRNLEGLLVSSVYTKSALSGWSTSLAIEKAALDAPLWRSLWIFGGGGSLLFAAALILSFYLGRRFVAPFNALTAMAESLGRGDRLPQSHLGLREPQIVADQLVLAADALQRQTDEREHLLVTLEQRVRERTHELDISTTKYRQVAS